MRLVYALVCVVFIAGLLFGCTAVQKGAAVGAAGGAGIGAIIGHQSDNAGKGALIGAGAGALAGALVGDAIEQKKAVTKFCPKCGKTFKDPQEIYCPYDGIELQLVK